MVFGYREPLMRLYMVEHNNPEYATDTVEVSSIHGSYRMSEVSSTSGRNSFKPGKILFGDLGTADLLLVEPSSEHLV